MGLRSFEKDIEIVSSGLRAAYGAGQLKTSRTTGEERVEIFPDGNLILTDFHRRVTSEK